MIGKFVYNGNHTTQNSTKARGRWSVRITVRFALILVVKLLPTSVEKKTSLPPNLYLPCRACSGQLQAIRLPGIVNYLLRSRHSLGARGRKNQGWCTARKFMHTCNTVRHNERNSQRTEPKQDLAQV
eukprot:1996647-Amphidinium_carterae.1